MANSSSSTPPPLLRLPLELRQHIYAYLLPPEPTSHPLPSVGITSVSHRPPSTSILSIHPQISAEILDYFFSITSWKLILSHAFNFFRVDPELRNLERHPILQRVKRVELVVYCDILLFKDYPSFGLDSLCTEIRKKADRACDVLLHGATNLQSVTVSWIDTAHPYDDNTGWEQKAAILTPLRKLSTKSKVKVGQVNGPEDAADRDAFLQAMRSVLHEQEVSERARHGMDRAEAEPEKLRMLAFDMRQERHLFKEPLIIQPETVRAKATARIPGWEPIAL